MLDLTNTTVSPSIEFAPWPKIGRIGDSIQVQITEKIDGTNACIVVEGGEIVACQSRKKFIVPGDDNAGFAGWAYKNRHVLAEVLGDGHHYGEWAGPAIQKNPMNLSKKKFFLFDPRRYDFQWEDRLDLVLDGGNLGKVPVLYEGAYFSELTERVMFDLAVNSRLRGYEAEGIITWWAPFRTMTKTTFKHSEGKWRSGDETEVAA